MTKISVVIAHFAVGPADLELLRKTVASIRHQDYSGEIEILVGDDGSPWPSDCPWPKHFTVLNRNEIRENTYLKDLQVDWFVLGPRNGQFNKAILWNICVKTAGAEKLIFLDDDHPFLSQHSVERYAHYLDLYPFVVGRIQNPDGRFRSYYDRKVQGSNFAMCRWLLNEVGGFGEYTSAWGCGDDPDLFWRVFSYFRMHSLLQSRPALYASEIITQDLRSGRWRQKIVSSERFQQGFLEKFGVDPYDNDSRDKTLWYAHSSRVPLLTEAWFRLRGGLSHLVKRVCS